MMHLFRFGLGDSFKIQEEIQCERAGLVRIISSGARIPRSPYQAAA